MNPELAVSITRSASRQTFDTVRFLADRDRVDDAYRVYAYFRWVDDTLDAGTGPTCGQSAFVLRQKFLLEASYRGSPAGDACPEERMLLELVRNDTERHSGLHTYLYNMMSVMEFDAVRRGRLVSQAELNKYTYWLASAVTEAMHHFIGHNCPSPNDDARYLAVSAAHITHMLRDAVDDARAGYFNIPVEFLEAHAIGPEDFNSNGYRLWVHDRVRLAREYFRAGRDYLHRVPSLRCRLAGFAYTARFELLLDIIEQDKFLLRPAYEGLKNMRKGWQLLANALASAVLPDRGYAAEPMRSSRLE